MWRYAESRQKLLEERDAARADSRLKSRFLSYRLNIPSEDAAKLLLTPLSGPRCSLVTFPRATARLRSVASI